MSRLSGLSQETGQKSAAADFSIVRVSKVVKYHTEPAITEVEEDKKSSSSSAVSNVSNFR